MDLSYWLFGEKSIYFFAANCIFCSLQKYPHTTKKDLHYCVDVLRFVSGNQQYVKFAGRDHDRITALGFDGDVFAYITDFSGRNGNDFIVSMKA